VKQPFFGKGTRIIPLRQSSRIFADGGCVTVGGGPGLGVCARPSGTINGATNIARPSAIIACLSWAATRRSRFGALTSFNLLAGDSSGLLPDLCSRGVRAKRSLTEGAGGFLPGVPVGCCCLGMWTGLRPRPSLEPSARAGVA
jgi:hypothetical protein